MKVMTINLNGIRSASRKQFFSWVQKQAPDILCVQEIKAQAGDIERCGELLPDYHVQFNYAEKKGYSGVGIFSKMPADEYRIKTEFDLADQEGRQILARFDDVWVMSCYLPSGTSGEARQALKMQYLDWFLKYLENWRDKKIILCGDFNIAHQCIDLKNWKSNQKHSGFLKEERAWLDDLFQAGWVDAFRRVNSQAEQYTWWSARGQARAKNVGWRIDYHIVSEYLKENIQSASIFPEPIFSDHAPLCIEYDLNLKMKTA